MKQLLYLISFFMCFAILEAFTLILRILTLCGCFRHPSDPGRPELRTFAAQ
jgi:hypothetical protein